MVCVLLTSLPTPVLIETYWNVKKAVIASVTISETRINRNILECKVKKWWNTHHEEFCINRNILECKVYCHSDSGCFLLPY